MGNVVTLRRSNSRFTMTFPATERDFGALDAARNYLKARGFSCGSLQGREPVGVLLGDVVIGKWRNLDAEDRADLHGMLTSPDFRSGAVTVSIRPDAPQTVIDAFLSSTVPESGADLIGADLADQAEIMGHVGVFDTDRAARHHVEQGFYDDTDEERFGG